MPGRLLPLLLLAPALAASAASPRMDLLYGHYEIHLDYQPVPGNPDAGWNFSVSYDRDDDFSSQDGVVRMDPDSTVILASPATARVVPTPPGTFSRFGPAGTPLWVLPQNLLSGTPYLGVRTTMAAGLFQARVGNSYSPNAQGSVSMRLVSMTGTGPAAGGQFATWKTESLGTTVFSFDSTDGIGAADEIPTIPVSSHTHYNWGFTKPGTYELTFEAKGKLMPAHGNVLTSARRTFRFAVPFSSSVAAGASVRVLPALAVANPAESVAYPPDRVMIEARQPAAAHPLLPGAQWQVPMSFGTGPLTMANGVGIDPALVSAGLPASAQTGLGLKIVSFSGPGNFAFLDGSTALADGVGDVLPLDPGTTRNLVAAFTAKGIFRLGVLVEGVPESTGPFTLVFGSGLGVDFTYQDWSASFEAAANLAPGTLADPQADPDRDGLTNSAEFLLFWHGLDPSRPDARLQPALTRDGAGRPAFPFLRDTYKDPLNGSSWQLRPGRSADLHAWHYRSPQSPGFPMELFENGAEEGNAWGRIMKRRLDDLSANPSRAFFRFDVTGP
ncbi:choice-of-anchor M domain-containing protein [Luteolibacter sp. GHJ8]|uniref:Choice-of-anchor M domain-containing protein n=1 Tax=Luteolibacter rhizosphaerae TaxID=2989719 RepID=A0ABT3FYW0_9BACT|nr:choice-of-anchor M domain-containing protein [Luteolibacter rhizosphaerae]MCW1912419.1 choice-of-anchor M domain-containing protein [Luteolibacter rhizosphaerae]